MTLILALYAPPDRAPITPREITGAYGLEDDEPLGFELGRPETGASCLVQLGEDPDSVVDDERAGAWRRTPWRLFVPTARAPFTARDLLPAAHAAAKALGARWSPLEGPIADDDARSLIAIWDRAHAEAMRALAQACAEAGAPLPPHRPARDLLRLHALLIALAAPPPAGVAQPPFALALDPMGQKPTRFAVRLPLEDGRVRLPLVDAVLADLEAGPGEIERPRVYDLAAVVEGAQEAPPGEETQAPGFVEIVVDERLRERLRELPHDDIGRFRVVTPVEVIDEESFAV